MKYVSIGGQAVLEGVMMRGRTAMATAVRDAEGVIRVESKRVTPPDKMPLLLRLPIIRGVVNFVNSLVGGSKTLMRSAEVYGEEEEPSKFEKWVAEKLHVDVMGVVTTLALILGLGLSVLLFVMLPQWVTNGIAKLTSCLTGITIQIISLESLKKVRIPLPPIDEQNKIAEKYEAILEELELLRMKTENAKDRLKHILDI